MVQSEPINNDEDPSPTVAAVPFEFQEFSREVQFKSSRNDDANDHETVEQEGIGGNPSEEVLVSVQLRSQRPTDDYATNIGLTGMALWYGAINLCDLIAAEPNSVLELEQRTSDTIPRPKEATQPSPQIRKDAISNSATRILELGCGSGLVGLFAAATVKQACEASFSFTKSSAHFEDRTPHSATSESVESTEPAHVAMDPYHVDTDGVLQYELVLTDCESSVMQNLRYNVHLNGWESNGNNDGATSVPSRSASRNHGPLRQHPKFLCASNVRIHCEELRWGKEGADHMLQTYGSFDVILGADLLYNGCDEALFTTVKMLLRAPQQQRKDQEHSDRDSSSSSSPVKDEGGRFYLAYTRRKHDITEACAIAQEAGLQWTIHPEHTIDIFGNYTDGPTVFWRDAIYIFTHAQQLLSTENDEGRGESSNGIIAVDDNDLFS